MNSLDMSRNKGDNAIFVVRVVETQRCQCHSQPNIQKLYLFTESLQMTSLRRACLRLPGTTGRPVLPYYRSIISIDAACSDRYLGLLIIRRSGAGYRPRGRYDGVHELHRRLSRRWPNSGTTVCRRARADIQVSMLQFRLNAFEMSMVKFCKNHQTCFNVYQHGCL